VSWGDSEKNKNREGRRKSLLIERIPFFLFSFSSILDGKVKVYDAKGPKELFSFSEHTAPVTAIHLEEEALLTGAKYVEPPLSSPYLHP